MSAESRSRSPPVRTQAKASPEANESSRKSVADREGRSRSRSHDRVLRQNERRRSTSPRGEHKPRRKDAGFKWKDRRRNEDDPPRDRDEGLRRGYRDHYKPRSRSRSPRRRDNDRYANRDRNRDQERDRDFGRDRERRPRDDRRERPERRDRKSEPEKKNPAPTPSMPQQPMIIVTVNDRLGTKKQIPCFPTDTVKDFKIIVASMIGRQPHQILLKRQGERPFKDVLTLQDYGVSNNIQLDLEVDTGD